MLALPKYVALSVGAITCVVAHALYTREQYFPAMMYLSTSKFALVTFGNFAFSMMLVLGHVVKATFLGTLREAEVERLYERTRDAVMETCLAMTIFREEFNARFVALFVSLLFIKAFHWLYQDRVQYAETAPTLSRTTHLRLAAFMGTLLMLDLSMLNYIVASTIEKGPSVLLLFGFEYVILATKLFVGFAKYLIINADRMLEGQWQGKGTCIFYLELVTDLLQLFVYFVFFLIIFAYYGMPVHLMRDLYFTYRNFRKRVEEFIRYRRVTANLNDRFPDSTADDLSTGDDVCIICRENMEADAQGGNKPKKLPCGHSFHLHCLRSWLERQQSCPTCRQSVLPERERRANAQRQAAEEAQWQQLPPELQAGYIPPEVAARLDREAQERREQRAVAGAPPTDVTRSRTPRQATTLAQTPPGVPDNGRDFAQTPTQTPTQSAPTSTDFTTTPVERTNQAHPFTGSRAWTSPNAFASPGGLGITRDPATGLTSMDDEAAHRVATAVASAVAAASSQAQLAFASIAPFGVPGLVEEATARAAHMAAPTPAPSPAQPARTPTFSPMPHDASPAVRAAIEAERQATLDAMQAQVRLLQAQMATFQEQASDESHSQLSRGARGKEPLSDTEDAPESAAPPPSQPPRREDDLDEPDTHVRRRRLQHFS
tara:strand:+ start:176 stop:2152 length:1977 start_codon:yes stop_codon:yes gene_type:complete